MSTSRRKRGSTNLDVVDNTEKTTSPKVVVKPKISFQAWFIQKTKAGNLRFYQDEAILVFFKKNGLSENEEPEAYDTCFLRF